MSCAFDLGHYRELLDAIEQGGYSLVFFDHPPKYREVQLRHDVDMSLEAALTMAELEADKDAHATYFLMRESEFYNLEAPSGRRALERLRELGHRVGLHAVHPRAEFDDRFDRVLAWHTPDPDFMSEPVDGAVNVMQTEYFDPAHYRSDSNQHWRSGCPHEELARGELDWLQLLVHPEIWVYPGETMRETMHAQLDAERELRLRQMHENRIELS